MPPRTQRANPGARSLVLAFVAVVGSFFASNLIVEQSSRAISDLAVRIIEDSSPSIEYLARVRKSVLEAELALLHFVSDPVGGPTTLPTLDDALRDVDKNTRAYLALPPNAGENALFVDVRASWIDFSAAISETRRMAAAKMTAEAYASLSEKVEPARARFLEAVTRVMEHNAVYGRETASEIRRVRLRTRHLVTAVNIACALLAAAVAWLLNREIRERRALLQAQLQLVHERAEELEQFAGRVAHDIRGPLSVAGTAAELVARRSSDDVTGELTTRLRSGLAHANAITSALLDFARAGAKPDPGARTPVKEVLDELISGLAPEVEGARIELRVDACSDVTVACSRGAYLSLATNLIRNAVKYMGRAIERRITVRVVQTDNVVRIEVVDTGPGIPGEMVESLFEPYFRAQRSGPEGLGLGLATVRKLAEGHGGRVGVSSQVGVGSTFWFELPGA
jgi:signal transduction histidine kinase